VRIRVGTYLSASLSSGDQPVRQEDADKDGAADADDQPKGCAGVEGHSDASILQRCQLRSRKYQFPGSPQLAFAEMPARYFDHRLG
jgi:hypothetical protein